MEFIPNVGNFLSESMRDMQIEFPPTSMNVVELQHKINDLERRLRTLELQKEDSRESLTSDE